MLTGVVIIQSITHVPRVLKFRKNCSRVRKKISSGKEKRTHLPTINVPNLKLQYPPNYTKKGILRLLFGGCDIFFNQKRIGSLTAELYLFGRYATKKAGRLAKYHSKEINSR
jgi:hypothetical protein